MPQVNTVIKARKDYPEEGIKKGETYYWWKFRFGGKVMSKTYPKRSQLTRSGFFSQLYDIEDRLSGIEVDKENIESDVADIVTDLENLRDECEEKRSNMPEQLQDVGSGETLQNRYDALDEMINELEGVDLDFEDNLTEEQLVERVEEIRDNLQEISYNGE